MEVKMYCSHCGKEISSEDSFCKYCGNKIEYKNISDSSSITVTRKVKTLHKPIIIGIIFLGLFLCISIVVIVVNMQKNKLSDNINVSDINEEADLKLTREEAIVVDVKTAARLQSATQAALADEKIYEAVCQLDWIYDHDILIMTINKNGEYIYPEGLDCLAEELKTNCGEDISIKYIEKGADSFNIYLTPQGGVCIYIGSKDNPRKWKVVPDADTLYQVNIEDENTDKEEATEIKKVETIDEAKEAHRRRHRRRVGAVQAPRQERPVRQQGQGHRQCEMGSGQDLRGPQRHPQVRHPPEEGSRRR